MKVHYIANQRFRLDQHSTLLFKRISLHGKYRRPSRFKSKKHIKSKYYLSLFTEIEVEKSIFILSLQNPN